MARMASVQKKLFSFIVNESTFKRNRGITPHQGKKTRVDASRLPILQTSLQVSFPTVKAR